MLTKEADRIVIMSIVRSKDILGLIPLLVKAYTYWEKRIKDFKTRSVARLTKTAAV
jgi:hypothetical protein